MDAIKTITKISQVTPELTLFLRNLGFTNYYIIKIFDLVGDAAIGLTEDNPYWLLEEFQQDGETVMFAPGAPFYETPGKGVNEVRIAYVLNCDELERAIELLAEGIVRYQKEVMKVTPPAADVKTK